MVKKEVVRQSFITLPPNPAVRGRLAEAIRRVDAYRNSTQVFVDPSPVLLQFRVNALVDGKDLIMPSAGLKQGFYLLKAFSIPFKKLLYAVTLKGAAALGRRLGQADLNKLDIGLLLAGAQALDNDGGRVGNGTGFFDLSAAILSASGALVDDYTVFGIVDDVQRVSEQIDLEPWDIVMQAIVTPDGVSETGAYAKTPEILWQHLSAKKVRKIDPLWALCPENRRMKFFSEGDKL